MENQQNKNFANCSQTSFAMRKFRKPVSQCENFANQIRNAKISQCEISQCEISQCQSPFRNAKTKFAMRKFRNAKFRNAKVHFAMPIPISQCQNRFRNANSKFAMRKFRNAKFRNAKVHFALRNSLPLRNSLLRNFQALSSSVINAEPPSIFGLLLFCPIT